MSEWVGEKKRTLGEGARLLRTRPNRPWAHATLVCIRATCSKAANKQQQRRTESRALVENGLLPVLCRQTLESASVCQFLPAATPCIPL